ncbi:MAG: response regulator [Ktedonobacteraceae bacterium]|nr:response regulator [Ktedonobacteraceae bacterium]
MQAKAGVQGTARPLAGAGGCPPETFFFSLFSFEEKREKGKIIALNPCGDEPLPGLLVTLATLAIVEGVIRQWPDAGNGAILRKEVICMCGANILLVEDDAVLCSVIERNLQARGHRVCVAADVQQALEQLRAQTFDLVFLDINLPDETGWDVLRTAHAEGRLTSRIDGRLPVVVLSAVRVSPRRLAEFHPLAYLPKPFPIEAVLRLAAEAAQRCHREGGEGQQTSFPSQMVRSCEEEFYA